jgi:hypothetical protein
VRSARRASRWPGSCRCAAILYLLANLMLIALGLYLLGFSNALAFTERLGQKLWRHLQPLTRRYLPARGPLQAFPLGLLWGWLPCGLVYSALATALSSGSACPGSRTDARLWHRHPAQSAARRPARRAPAAPTRAGRRCAWSPESARPRFWCLGLLGLQQLLHQFAPPDDASD